MKKILTYLLIGIGLSMDTFSLSLSLGTNHPSLKNIRRITVMVGIFHFFMPLIGNLIGEKIEQYWQIHTSYVTSLIFFLLALQMFLDRNKEEENYNLKLGTILLLAFTVSIDSLSVGIAFSLANENIILASSIFMIVSAIFTFLGLSLGEKIRDYLQNKATYIGILLMLGMSLKYFFFS